VNLGSKISLITCFLGKFTGLHGKITCFLGNFKGLKERWTGFGFRAGAGKSVIFRLKKRLFGYEGGTAL
jgi:hypothetical protein